MRYKVTVIALIMSVSSMAHAEDPRKLQSDVLYRQGFELHEKGSEKEALEMFQQSYEAYPTPNTLVSIARSEELLGDLLTAMRHYREALQNPLLHPRNEARAREYIKVLEEKLGRFDVKAPTGTVFVFDGQRYITPLEKPIDVVPGTIEISGTYGDTKYSGHAVAAAGSLTRVELMVVKSPTATSTMIPSSTEREKSYWTGQHITGVALGGLAVVAAGFGIGFLAARESHVSDMKSVATDPIACREQASGACQKYLDAKDGKKSATTGEVISFVAAGALAIGAAVLLWPKPTKEGVTARVVPTGQGFLIDGAF